MSLASCLKAHSALFTKGEQAMLRGVVAQHKRKGVDQSTAEKNAVAEMLGKAIDEYTAVTDAILEAKPDLEEKFSAFGKKEEAKAEAKPEPKKEEPKPEPKKEEAKPTKEEAKPAPKQEEEPQDLTIKVNGKEMTEQEAEAQLSAMKGKINEKQATKDTQKVNRSAALQDKLKKEYADLTSDGTTVGMLQLYHKAKVALGGASSFVSKAEEYEDTPTTQRPLADPRTEDGNRIAAAAQEQGEAAVYVTQKLAKLVEKYGVGGVDAMFALAKKGTETKGGDLAREAKIELSNIWRHYRDGTFSGFGFTRINEADTGRTNKSKGGYQSVIQDWYDGKKTYLNKKGDNSIEGVFALAYMMRIYGANQISRALGGRMYHVLQEAGATKKENLGFQVVDKWADGDHPGRQGIFIEPGSPLALKMKIKAPTILIHKDHVTEDVLAHEMLHAVTWTALKGDPKSRARFTPILKAIERDKAKAKGAAAGALDSVLGAKSELARMSELLSYGFTHKEFQDFLKTVKVTEGKSTVGNILRTAFDMFVNLVKLTLGVHAAPNSALARLIEAGAYTFDVAEQAGVSGKKGGVVAQLGAEAGSPAQLESRTTPTLNILNPVSVMDHAARKVAENLIPWSPWKTKDGGKMRIEEWAEKYGPALADHVIYDMPEFVSRHTAGWVSGFGLPAALKPVTDMGRRLDNNAGQVSAAYFSNIVNFSPEQQELLHKFNDSDGKMDISALPEESRAFVRNVRENWPVIRDVWYESLDKKQQKPWMKNASINDVVNWVEADKGVSFGLKASSGYSYKARPKEFKESVFNGQVVGDGPNYYKGEFTEQKKDVNGNVEDVSKSVYISTDTTLADAEKLISKDIKNLKTDVTFKVFSKGKNKTKMYRTIPYAEGLKIAKGVSYSQALALALNNVMHDTAVYQFGMNAMGVNAENKGSLIFADTPEGRKAFAKLHADHGGERLLLDPEKLPGGAKAPSSLRLMRTPKYWVKLGKGYGELSNHFVPSTMYGMLTDINKPWHLGSDFKSVINYWKKTKTAFSVPTHFNNIASSFVMLYMAGVPVNTLVRAAKVMFAVKPWNNTIDWANAPAEKQALKRIWDDFAGSGALVASFSANELTSSLATNLDAALRAQHGVGKDSSLLGVLHTWEQVKNSTVGKKARDAANVAVTTYEHEDNLFRLAAYLHKKEELGSAMPPAEARTLAGKFAADAMINYSIDARYINNLRATVLPFISWPYRMVPMLVRMAIFQPWKYATIVGSIYVLDKLMYAIFAGDDDQDEERKKLPKYAQEPMWALGGAPSAIRLWNWDSKPIYVNVSGFLPLGNIAQGSQNAGFMGQTWWPQGLTPSGPLMAAAQIATGRDIYTGKDLYKPADSGWEKAGTALKTASTEFTPNFPIPYMNRQGDKLLDILGGTKGIGGDVPDQLHRMASFLGPKFIEVNDKDALASYNIGIRQALTQNREKYMSEIRAAMRQNADSEKIAKIQSEYVIRLREAISKAKGEEQ